MDDTTVALRLAVAAGLGGLLGLERELRGQSAGLRTHMLVSLGACLFTLVSIFAAYTIPQDVPAAALGPTGLPDGGVRADVTRIASQVVVGIGFLGAGSILHHGATIRGLTTAANLWVTASMGLAVGMGFYLGGVLTAAFSLVALAGLKPIEEHIARWRERRHEAEDSGASSAGPERREGDGPTPP